MTLTFIPGPSAGLDSYSHTERTVRYLPQSQIEYFCFYMTLTFIPGHSAGLDSYSHTGSTARYLPQSQID